MLDYPCHMHGSSLDVGQSVKYTYSVCLNLTMQMRKSDLEPLSFSLIKTTIFSYEGISRIYRNISTRYA